MLSDLYLEAAGMSRVPDEQVARTVEARGVPDEFDPHKPTIRDSSTLTRGQRVRAKIGDVLRSIDKVSDEIDGFS